MDGLGCTQLDFNFWSDWVTWDKMKVSLNTKLIIYNTFIVSDLKTLMIMFGDFPDLYLGNNCRTYGTG